MQELVDLKTENEELQCKLQQQLRAYCVRVMSYHKLADTHARAHHI